MVATSSIAYVELRAALARRERERAFSRRDHGRIIKALEKDWPQLLAVELRDALIRDAGDTAQRYALRAYDAVHLASFFTAAETGLPALTDPDSKG